MKERCHGLLPLVPPVTHTPLLALQPCVLYFISSDFCWQMLAVVLCSPLTLSVDATPKQICLTNELPLVPPHKCAISIEHSRTEHMLCVYGRHTHTHTHTRMGGNVCFNSEGMTPSCQHDPVSPSSSPLPFLNISAILSLHPPLISHTHSPLTPLSLPQAQGPASEMSAPISHVGWCVLSVSFIIEWTDMFSAKLACAQWWKGYLDLWLKLKVVRV